MSKKIAPGPTPNYAALANKILTTARSGNAIARFGEPKSTGKPANPGGRPKPPPGTGNGKKPIPPRFGYSGLHPRLTRPTQV